MLSIPAFHLYIEKESSRTATWSQWGASRSPATAPTSSSSTSWRSMSTSSGPWTFPGSDYAIWMGWHYPCPDFPLTQTKSSSSCLPSHSMIIRCVGLTLVTFPLLPELRNCKLHLNAIETRSHLVIFHKTGSLPDKQQRQPRLSDKQGKNPQLQDRCLLLEVNLNRILSSSPSWS